MSWESNDAFEAYAAREGYRPGTWNYIRAQRAWQAAIAWALTHGVNPCEAPSYGVRWSTSGYVIYTKPDGRTLTPEEVERALGVGEGRAETLSGEPPMGNAGGGEDRGGGR